MPSEIPIAQVKGMKSQGLNNNQIIQALQRDGFSSSQIFDALNQVELGASAPAMNQGKNNMGQNFPPPISQGEALQQGMPPPPPPMPVAGKSVSTEELVEAIIDEKWNDLVKDITTIVEWKNQAQNTINSLEQQFKDLKDQFDKLHQALISKIGEYDKNILDVGAEVKAMEKVFSKVLPVFTANVAELDKITKTFKSGKRVPSSKKE